MHHKHWVRSNQKDADFPFHNAWHKPHVYQHAIVANNVLVTEIHELAELADFGVVIYGFGAA